MSRSRPVSIPLSFHKPTGQYYVTRNRKRVYLGADQDESLDKYHRMALGLRTTPQLVMPRLLPRDSSPPPVGGGQHIVLHRR